MAKRLVDLFGAITGLLVLAPLLLLVAIWIKVDSPGPVLFRQERVGRRGELFRIYKFRTMRQDSSAVTRQITVDGDPRITRFGSLLRRIKFDELPQLVNVLVGDMSLVGPRPEVPKYVDMYPPEIRRLILSVRPGITDNASLKFADESAILGKAADPEAAYVNEILPVKLRLYADYVAHRTLLGDIAVILKTVRRVFARTE